MSFGDEITKLKFGATDNSQRNTQAETDLQNKLDQFETDLQINNELTSFEYLPKFNWKRLYENPLSYQNSIIGYKEDILQSIELGHPTSTTQFSNFNFTQTASANLFLSSFFYPKCNSYVSHLPLAGSEYIQHYKKFDCLILNNHEMSDASISNGGSYDTFFRNSSYYHMRDFGTSGISNSNKDGKIVDEMLDNVISPSYSDRYTSAIQKESSSLPSITLRFSVNKTTDSSWDIQTNGFMTKGIWVGLFLLNQPLWSLPETADLSLRYPQSDCFFSLIEIEGQTSSYNVSDSPTGAFPQSYSQFNPASAKLFCGRLDSAGNRTTPVVIDGGYTHIYTSQLYSPLRFDTNYTSSTISGCDGNFTNSGQTFNGYSDQGSYIYVKGPVINELKFEYGHMYDSSGNALDTFMINVFYNGNLVEMMVTSRSMNPSLSRGWWNQCHYIPGIILNAPEGMIKIHSFETDMD